MLFRSLEGVFRIILHIHRVQELQRTHPHRYIVAAYVSSQRLASSQAKVSWYRQAELLLSQYGLDITSLPRGTHAYIRRTIFRSYIQRIWLTFQTTTLVRQPYYQMHFLQLDLSGLPVLPGYLMQPLPYSLRYRMG